MTLMITIDNTANVNRTLEIRPQLLSSYDSRFTDDKNWPMLLPILVRYANFAKTYQRPYKGIL